MTTTDDYYIVDDDSPKSESSGSSWAVVSDVASVLSVPSAASAAAIEDAEPWPTPSESDSTSGDLTPSSSSLAIFTLDSNADEGCDIAPAAQEDAGADPIAPAESPADDVERPVSESVSVAVSGVAQSVTLADMDAMLRALVGEGAAHTVAVSAPNAVVRCSTAAAAVRVQRLGGLLLHGQPLATMHSMAMAPCDDACRAMRVAMKAGGWHAVPHVALHPTPKRAAPKRKRPVFDLLRVVQKRSVEQFTRVIIAVAKEVSHLRLATAPARGKIAAAAGSAKGKAADAVHTMRVKGQERRAARRERRHDRRARRQARRERIFATPIFPIPA